MKNFKLMQVLPSLRSGGVEQGTLDVANHLASQDIKNFICSNGGPMLSFLNKKNVSHYSLPVHSKNFLRIPFIAKKINKFLKDNDINIIHFRSRALAWLLPFIDKKNIKTISTFHNVYSNQNFIKTIYNTQLGRVDKIVAISNYVKDEIINNYKFESEKITVINRGIDIDYFDYKIKPEQELNKFISRYNIELDKKIILYPGRLTSWKGQIEFLDIVEAFKAYPIIFYFVGDNKNKSYSENLKKKINSKNLNKNCKIFGHLNKEDLKVMYFFSNLVISAPLKPEGFGRIVSETLAMKKIILAYNVGGVKDQLNSLDNIYKVKNKDSKEMIFKIKKILELSDNEIFNLGNIARSHVINNFSKQNMLNSYLNLYQEL